MVLDLGLTGWPVCSGLCAPDVLFAGVESEALWLCADAWWAHDAMPGHHWVSYALQFVSGLLSLPTPTRATSRLRIYSHLMALVSGWLISPPETVNY